MLIVFFAVDARNTMTKPTTTSNTHILFLSDGTIIIVIVIVIDTADFAAEIQSGMGVMLRMSHSVTCSSVEYHESYQS